MHFYLVLLTFILAASVDATNTSSPFCPFEVSTPAFPLALRPSDDLSLPFNVHELSVFNSSLPLSPVLPVLLKYKQFVKKPFINVSQPILEPFFTVDFDVDEEDAEEEMEWVEEDIEELPCPLSPPSPVGMDVSMLTVLGWVLLNLLMSFFTFALFADVSPLIEEILAEIVADLEEEQFEDAVETEEKQRFLLEIVDFNFDDEQAEEDIDWVEEDFEEPPCPPPSPISDDEESHC